MTVNWFYARRRLNSRRRSVGPTFETLEDRCLLASFLVNSPDDPGLGVCDAAECTLREAILAANANPGLDDIQFNIGMGGVISILPKNALPAISDAVNIDGTTQPGFVAPGPPIVELNGSLLMVGNGLFVNTVGSTIRGLVINRFPGSGILSQGGGGHKIAGNNIGANLTGVAIAANGGSGILMLDSSANTIGGTVAGDANLIVGNLVDGIGIQAGMQHVIQGNFIGIDSQNTAGLGNTGAGISMQNSLSNQIGGSNSTERNVIASNGGDGVFVASGVQNRIIGNSLFSNGGLGIDLGANGPNFPQDSDPGLGANDSQNFPELTSATASNNSTFVQGTLNSSPGVNFVIAFYASSAADPVGFGEGQLFLGQLTKMTDAAGFAQIDDTLPIAAPAGSVITATATHTNGDTSEFSQAIPLTVPQFQFDMATYPVGESGGSATITVLRSNGSAGQFAVEFSTSDGTASASSDYKTVTKTLTFPSGSTMQVIDILITADALDESNETVNLALTMPSAGSTLGVPNSAVLTILDDDPKLDLNVRTFATAVGSPEQLEIQYEIIGAAAPRLEFAFFASADARFDPADTEQPPRLFVTNPADLTTGSHTVRFSGTPYAPILNSLDTPFVVTHGLVSDAAGNVLVESDATNNDVNFVGLFHPPGAPLLLRGKDDTDRYVDNPSDTVSISGGVIVTVTADFLVTPIAIDATSITEIRVLGLGGSDSIIASGDVVVRLLVRGGLGNDTVTGGQAADLLAGDAGDDVLAGRLGNDVLDGGVGTDTADFSVELHGVIANLTSGTAKGQGRDTLAAIENLIGSPGRDRLTGNAADNVLFGAAGADLIVGGAGADILGGGDGDDSIFGEAGDDVLAGDAGNDLVCGGDGADRIAGGTGDDHLDGGTGDDDVRGDAGADFICGGDGNDLLAGNAGNDTLVGESGIDRLLGGLDFDSILFDLADRPFNLGGAGRDGGKAFRFG